MAEDIKKPKTSNTMEELAKAIRSGKDLDPGIKIKRGEDRSIPMPRLMADKDTEYTFGNGLKYKPSEVKPGVVKDGLLLLKKGGVTKKMVRGGGIESHGKTKGRMV
jgi:hypothetical protein